ncbi:MAG TPA: ABC transporter substrate binding protein [Myxococcota bacterium]|nr:ABC transporter substrate binding protein [Myxococcota bacterium]
MTRCKTAMLAWVALTGLASLQTACTVRPLAIKVHPAPTAEATRIVVLQSQETTLLDTAVASFVKKVDAEVTVISDTRDANAGALAAAVQQIHPRFVFTLGTPAINFARKHIHDTPILYAMAINYATLHEAGPANIMGIAMEPTPLSEFAKFRMVAPDLRRVAVMYTQGSTDRLVEKARGDLADLDVELLPIAVLPGADAAAAYRAHSGESDALWLMDDADVMQQFEALKKVSLTEHKPLLASLSDSFARAGALMAVSIDAESIGVQAASIARRVLERGATPEEIGVQRPLAVRLVVNARVARMLGLEISEDVLPYISELVQAR